MTTPTLLAWWAESKAELLFLIDVDTEEQLRASLAAREGVKPRDYAAQLFARLQGREP